MKVSIKAMRVNRGMTQKKAAKVIGVSRETLLKWENNNTSPTAVQLIAICNAYHCKMDDILLPERLIKT